VEPVPSDSEVVRIRTLERLEVDLVARLEQCIPPVDQHRVDLERVRSELTEARGHRTS
jgi:hypothetical protein